MSYGKWLSVVYAGLVLTLFPRQNCSAQELDSTAKLYTISDSLRSVLSERWDTLVAGGLSPDSAVAVVESEFGLHLVGRLPTQQKQQDIANESVGAVKEPFVTAEKAAVWLWLVPLVGVALIVRGALVSSRLKSWVGELHWGQLLILLLLLFFSGAVPFGLGLVLADLVPGLLEGQYWTLGFFPLGVLAALVVLWWWFGARQKPIE